jgi:gliding motility-associated-like protein/uncharacterized repeat protein (TIGR01451 family)
MHSVNYPVKDRLATHLKLFCVFFLLFPIGLAFAEGSKELSANGGSRAFMVSGTTANAPAFLYPTNGTMKVYAKAGEVINVGSSVQGVGAGTMNLRAPNGATYTSGTSATVGLIANRSQEVAGPLPNAGGYTPYTHTVLAAEEGVWEVDFISQNNGALGAENPVSIAASANWVQPTGQYIAAFDVSVRNTANTAFLTGRVFTNEFLGILGDYLAGFNAIVQVLTKDGYLYTLDNNGQAGNGFSFFVNNKGFRKADGTASFQSINSLANPNVQDPRVDDTPTDITYKIFFNTPAADLPTTAKAPVTAFTPSGSTWLLNPVTPPTIAAFTFTGIEGTPNKAGTSPLGAVMAFTASKNGTYAAAIDVNKNGIFTDPIDRKLTGTVIAGQNQFAWDGLDGLGNKVPAGNYTTNLNVVLFGGEVHFPYFDVERNVNGLKLTRINGLASPEFTVYWDDSTIPLVGTPSNPITNLAGISSQVNGHKWGTAGPTEAEFGNNMGMDTWAYIAATPLSATLNFQLQEADLEVLPITSSASGVSCAGQQISYTVSVRNNGPNDVVGSKFNITFPASLTGVTLANTATTGTSGVSNGATTATSYASIIDLANGAVRTFTLTGTVAGTAAGTSVTVSAGILRTADMTDPDATNPDAAPPTDATVECNSAPSGPGCNNIKTSSSLTFLALPNAGPDQSINQGAVVTLTDANPGTWAQIGSTPVAVAIATPAALSTTVTGFTDVGKYQFVRTNAAGCTDTVVITVVPKNVDVPSVFTPNGDGKNDTFTIPNILAFPGTQLYIYNRWGNEVYRSDNYQNTWDGAGLSEGTYYYVLNKKEVSGSYTTYKGWLFLKR